MTRKSVSFQKGPIMAKKRYYDKAMESRDGAMIGTSTGQANMPQNVIMKNYPKGAGYMPEDLNDGLSGIDNQMSSDHSDAKGSKPDSKY